MFKIKPYFMKWNNFYKKIVVNEFYFCYDFDTLISMKESQLNMKVCGHNFFFATTLRASPMV